MARRPCVAVALPATVEVGAIIGHTGFLGAAEFLIVPDILAKGRIGQNQVEPAGKDPIDVHETVKREPRAQCTIAVGIWSRIVDCCAHMITTNEVEAGQERFDRAAAEWDASVAGLARQPAARRLV